MERAWPRSVPCWHRPSAERCSVCGANELSCLSLMIGNAAERFDPEGRLPDETTREFVRALLVALKDWTERLRR